MAQNGHRAIGLYDEGRFLLRALANGEGSGFNASTMAKLFNGSVWKRTVVKDQNRFSMAHTCLCLAMSCHIEEWHDFLSKDGALGMASRFLMFHSAPRLDKASQVLDASVYARNSQDGPAPRLPESLLAQFVAVLHNIDTAHSEESDDYDQFRADRHCRSEVALYLLRKQYPALQLVASDCEFVFTKLEAIAPHLLGVPFPAPAPVPLHCLQPSVRPRTGDLLSFSQQEQQRSCRAQWDKLSKARRSGGIVTAARECQITCAVKLVYTHESPTGIYFFLAEIFQFHAQEHGVCLDELRFKER
ncbi:unnamed protein product, partial [Effrenium voratum]